MGSLDSGKQTADAIARVACWCNRGCTNSSHGFMDSSVAIRRYHRMGSLDPGMQTADAIARAVDWRNRGCTNGSYGLTDSSIAIR